MFKPAPLGAPPKPGYERENPRKGVKIFRDEFGVAHVNGKTQADVAYGAGWVTAADRGLLLQLIRGAGTSGRTGRARARPARTRADGQDVRSQPAGGGVPGEPDRRRASQGSVGPKILALVNAYAAGINGYFRAKGIPATPFTANDVIASAALIAARFGTNGGQEVQNSMFVDALAIASERPTRGTSSPTSVSRTTRSHP
jgi:acyl-homoserine-lactone acylase